MVVPEIVCLVQGYSTVRFKDLAVVKKKDRNFFGALRRKSSSGQLSQAGDDGQICPPSSTPPPSYAEPNTQQERLDMVPGGRGGETALSAQQCAAEILIATPGSSKARQKKFHRHFKTVAQDERVLNYYSCALVAEILLQGHLYITKNYFAFYSNVFGYVTKLLIPTSTVLKVTKEKTAYIIPNAVGITTEDDKHVFGSLLSRDSTYKLMVQVWTAAMKPTPIHLPIPSKRECMDQVIKEDLVVCAEIPILNDEESSLSGSESNLDSKITNTSLETKSGKHTLGVEVKSYHDMFSQTAPTKHSYAQCYSFLSAIPRPTILLVISTVLLVVLFTSAAILLYRVARLQQQGYSGETFFSTRSISEVQEFLDSNLEQISKVRQSLETLSLLIEGGGNELGRRKWNHFTNTNENFQHNS